MSPTNRPRTHSSLRRPALASLAAALSVAALAHGQTKPASPPPDPAKKIPLATPKAPPPKDAPAVPAAPGAPAAPAMPAAPAGGAPAVTPVPNAPEPKVLWEKFIEACGGREAIHGGGSRRAKGRLEIPAAGMSGTVETFAKAPDRMLVKTTMGQFGVIEQGFDGTNAWANDQMTGPRLLEGPELDSFRRDASYDGPFGYLEKARSASTLGKATFADKECWVVELKETIGGDLTCYLDANDGLLRGMRMVSETQMGKIPVEMVVAEYATFGKVKVPSKSLTRVMMQEFTSTIDEVSWEPIPDSMFEPPAAVKTLIEAKKNAPAGPAAPPARSAPGNSTPPAAPPPAKPSDAPAAR